MSRADSSQFGIGVPVTPCSDSEGMPSVDGELGFVEDVYFIDGCWSVIFSRYATRLWGMIAATRIAVSAFAR